MNIQTSHTSLEALQAEKQQLATRRASLEEQQQAAQAKASEQAIAIAERGGTAAEANGLIVEQQSIALLLTGVTTLEARVDLRIAAEVQRLRFAQLAAQWAAVRALLDQRNTAIDAAEEALSEAARQIQAALEFTSQAAISAPQRVGGHKEAEILEGMLLVPAMTERFWLQLGFTHPAIPSMDNLYARVRGKISEIFSHECNFICPAKVSP